MAMVKNDCNVDDVVWTNYCENICLIKFADDTTLHGLLSNSEEAYRSEVNRFCEWCKNNHLTLNVDKTKELVFDYRRKK